MLKTLIIQSYRDNDVPAWIARCMDSVRRWAAASGHDYRLTGDEVFQLCGADYLAKVGDNKRSITNLARLELIKRAHRDGYDRAIWVDADIFVFDPTALRFDLFERCAFAAETFLWRYPDGRWSADHSVNNSLVLCMAGEPDLDLMIAVTRHVAAHHPITTNYQVGGDIIKGMRRILKFRTLKNVGMFSHFVVHALANRQADILKMQAVQHRAPVYAANLCAAGHYQGAPTEAHTLRAMELLESTRGDCANGHLSQGA